MLTHLLILGGFAAAQPEPDRIRIRREAKVEEPDCFIKELTCDRVRFTLGEEASKEENADNVEEIFLSRTHKTETFLRAEDEMADGKFDQAVRTWSRAAEEVKKDPIAYQVALYKAALSYYQLGRLDEALQAYRAMIARVPDSFYLKKAFLDMFGCARAKRDDKLEDKIIQELEAEAGKRNKPAWSRHARILRANQLESLGKFQDAAGIYAQSASERGQIGEEAQTGELRCLSKLQRWDPLKSRAEMIIHDAARRTVRSRCAAFNALGEVALAKDKDPKVAMKAFLRGITEFDKDLRGTSEHMTSLAFSAISMAEYAKTLKKEAEKDQYLAWATRLTADLGRSYPRSPFLEKAKEATK